MLELVLGTAQFGSVYGATNRVGMLDEDAVRDIVTTAWDSGIRTLDTAPAYGSEVVLGTVMGEDQSFRINTKTPRKAGDAMPGSWRSSVETALEESLSRLRRPQIHTLFVHNTGDLAGPHGGELWNTMQNLKSQGKVERCGVSLYCDDWAASIVETLRPDVVQIPINVFDQRFQSNGLISRFSELGITIQARSVFLQGILLIEREQLPLALMPLASHLSAFAKEMGARGKSQLQGALAYVASLPQISEVVVGVTGKEELMDVIYASREVAPVDLFWSQFQVGNEQLIDPRRWPKLS